MAYWRNKWFDQSRVVLAKQKTVGLPVLAETSRCGTNLLCIISSSLCWKKCESFKHHRYGINKDGFSIFWFSVEFTQIRLSNAKSSTWQFIDFWDTLGDCESSVKAATKLYWYINVLAWEEEKVCDRNAL